MQLTEANRLLKNYKDDFQKVRRVPIYDIQGIKETTVCSSYRGTEIITVFMLPAGKQYTAVVISTYEPIYDDVSTRNPTKSISNPFVFNTVISRTKYMVVAVGNPFDLLRKEKHMVEMYGKAGKCWSHFMKSCLEKGTFSIHSSIPSDEQSYFMPLIKIKIDEALQYKGCSIIKYGHNKNACKACVWTGVNWF